MQEKLEKDFSPTLSELHQPIKAATQNDITEGASAQFTTCTPTPYPYPKGEQRPPKVDPN